jgi:redox-sensitive bicupin YhaK (pirin superfamily)
VIRGYLTVQRPVDRLHLIMKNIQKVYSAPSPHWVGDGFPARSLFSYNTLGQALSPFLLLDYAGPAEFSAKPPRRRGVGEHPHRGFETVTIVYEGEVEHRDSAGGGGVIGPGDVQWMTAGSGLVHDEFHSAPFTERGGALEMIQLWVNLPKASKMTPRATRPSPTRDIPVVALPGEAGRARVIAGELLGQAGPASTHSPVNVWDLRVSAGKRVALSVPHGHTLAVVVLRGTVQLNDEEILRSAQLAVFDHDGEVFSIEANNDATVLVLSGEPLREPIVGYGPFVMNTKDEIEQAIRDFNSGRFGHVNRNAP